jgi:hypothetical protein
LASSEPALNSPARGAHDQQVKGEQVGNPAASRTGGIEAVPIGGLGSAVLSRQR